MAIESLVKQKLNVESEALQENYLGMPTHVERTLSALSVTRLIGCGNK
jgi:hypothetical protein